MMLTGGSEMISLTQLTPAALDEAAAIVEAEWLRLQRHGARRVDEQFEKPAESAAPSKRPPSETSIR